MMKRLLDVFASVTALVLLAPIMLLVGVAVRIDSPGPAVFRHQRVGRHFVPFEVLKFRTMRSELDGPQVTAADDQRITRVGAMLRRTKLDELPQLINVLRGEMSLVGPRPEVARYVEAERTAYEVLLRVRPGITDPATLAFPDEQALLARQPDPERFYEEVLLPEKLALSLAYAAEPSLIRDVSLLIRTIVRIVR